MEPDISNMTLNEYLMYQGRHRDLERSYTSRKSVAPVRNRILVYSNSDEEDEGYCSLHPLLLCFQTPQPCATFNSVHHNSNMEVDIDNMTLEEYARYEVTMSNEILDDLFRIGAENLRKMEHEVPYTCDNKTVDITDYEDSDHKDGELHDLPIFSASLMSLLEVPIEDDEMDDDVDHSNTNEALQWSLAKDPFLVCIELKEQSSFVLHTILSSISNERDSEKEESLEPQTTLSYKMSQPANDEFSQHLSDDEESNHEDASDTGNAPKQQQQVIPQTTAISNIKLPILKKEEYDIWAMEMEHYLEYIDNEVWKVIQNGNSKKRISTGKDERRLRISCRWPFQRKSYERFMEWMMQKRSGKPSELDLQQLLSQLEAHGAEVSTEDANHKFLRSLPPAWSNLAMTMRTNPEIDTLSIDDLYNNLRVFEQEIQEVLAGFADEVIYSLFAKQSEDWDLLHEDLEQIDDVDIEEMDINWQIAMIAIRMKKFYKKTGRRVRVDGKTPVGFDKKKLECFNCHNTGHFARECTTKGTHDGKKKRDSSYQHQEEWGKQREDQMGVLTMEDGIVIWGETYEVEETKACTYGYQLKNELGDQEAQILAYSQAVKKLEAQLVTFQKQQLSLNEKLTFQANEIHEKDEKLKRYRRIGMKAVKEKEQLQKTLDSWKDSSKNLWRLINSGMSSNNKLGLGYEIQSNDEVLSYEEEMNFSVFKCSKEDSIGKPLYSRFTKTNDFKGVPHPLSGDYTPKPQEEIDDSLYVYGKKGPQKPEISVSDDNSSEHSTCQSNDSEGSCGNTSEHSFETESESLSEPNEMSKSRLEITNEKVVSELQEVEPSCAKHVKTPRQPLKDKETHKVNRKNWNDMMERELGEGYSFTKKKCFVCGSLSHLIKDCDYYEKKMAREAEVKRVVNTGNGVAKPVWTNANRINHSNKFVPRSVQLNAGRPKFNSVRPNINTGRTNINSVRPKVNAVSSNVNTVRSRQPVPNKTSNSFSPKRPQMNQINQRRDFSKSHSSVRRPFAKTTAQMSHSNAVMGNWGSAVKTSASYNWRNSRPNFNYNSGPTFIRTVNAKGPQGRPKPVKAWTATTNTIADGTLEIRATIDTIGYTITEASIRDSLQLADATGITMLPNDEIFEGMGQIGYPTDGTFTFWKSFFTPQWRYLVHHLLHYISSKSGGWDQFGSNIATALICLSTDRVYNFSKLIFDGMVANLKSKTVHVTILDTLSITKKEKILTDPQQKEKVFSIDTLEDNPKIQAFRRELEQIALKHLGTVPENNSTVLQLIMDGVITDFNSLPIEIEVSPTPTLRFHNIHPKSQILGDPKSAVQTRSKEEPKKIAEALQDDSWVQAMQEELLQFKLQQVWVLVDLPHGMKVIGTKWVYKNKRDERGVVVRNKARLVAQGYTQEEGIDYDEVFAPVARIEAIRLFLAFASFMGFIVFQMDVKSAFRLTLLMEEVYVLQLLLVFVDPDHPNKVYKVVKALYGLHQAPRAWDKKDIMLVQVYVDDIIFGSTNKSWCDEFEALMKSRFQMSSMGELTFFLGLQVKQNKGGIFISQDKYVAEILKKFDLVNVKAAITPMETKVPLTKDEEAIDVDVHLYRSMIGSLMYLTASRPDIMYAVCVCSRFQVTPKTSHLNVVKRIFKYLKGKPNLGLWYPRESPFDLEAFSNSDYGGSNLDRKSTTGGCQFLGQRLISWQCKKQTIVATSTTEAEYVAAANCCGQVLWVQNQLLDYGFNFMNTKIHIDNESTICIVKNPFFSFQDKHIEIRHHFIRDCYEKKLISVEKIHTDLNVADLLTKPFDGPRFNYLVVSIGFAEIVDFLRGSNLRYAFTSNPPIYDSLVKQFWQTATINTIADETLEIHATIDIKGYTITEASIKDTLQLADATGITMLPNDEIFEGMGQMGSRTSSCDSNSTIIITIPGHIDIISQVQSPQPIHASIPTPTPISKLKPDYLSTPLEPRNGSQTNQADNGECNCEVSQEGEEAGRDFEMKECGFCQTLKRKETEESSGEENLDVL
ncbi:putative ribonuclease H-like domain-containing protein [Tanacetum coccineum]